MYPNSVVSNSPFSRNEWVAERFYRINDELLSKCYTIFYMVLHGSVALSNSSVNGQMDLWIDAEFKEKNQSSKKINDNRNV